MMQWQISIISRIATIDIIRDLVMIPGRYKRRLQQAAIKSSDSNTKRPRKSLEEKRNRTDKHISTDGKTYESGAF